MAGAWDFLPPFSFWAAIISCLLRSASSSAFFFARASASFFSASSCEASPLQLSSVEFLLFLCSFIPPLVDVLLQLIIQLALLGFVFG